MLGKAPNLRQVLVENLEFLRERGPDALSRRKLARKAEISPQTVNNIYRPDGPSPTVSTVELLAQALRVEPWLLLLPQMQNLLASGLRPADLLGMLTAFVEADNDGRQLILQVAERAGRYESNPKNPGPTNPTASRPGNSAGPRSDD